MPRKKINKPEMTVKDGFCHNSKAAFWRSAGSMPPSM